MAIPRVVHTHPIHQWEYIVDTLEPVCLSIAEPDQVILVDFLLHHEEAAPFRVAMLSKAVPPHGPSQLEHLLMLEVLDMKHPRSPNYGEYLTLARRARDWATELCHQDFIHRVTSPQDA